jgi:hypothetical protein
MLNCWLKHPALQVSTLPGQSDNEMQASLACPAQSGSAGCIRRSQRLQGQARHQRRGVQ